MSVVIDIKRYTLALIAYDQAVAARIAQAQLKASIVHTSNVESQRQHDIARERS